MTPSELLVAAADRIRDLAAAATPGQWEIEYDYTGTHPQALFRMDPEHPDDPDRSFSMGGMIYGADNAWIAALSPAVAPHLEAWLREAGEHWKLAEHRPAVVAGKAQSDFVGATERAALALARALMTGETNG